MLSCALPEGRVTILSHFVTNFLIITANILTVNMYRFFIHESANFTLIAGQKPYTICTLIDTNT